MSGAHTGFVRVHVSFSGIGSSPETVTGTASSNYDGTTISGIPHVPQPCPRALPRAPHMGVTAGLVRRGVVRFIRVRVTATVRQAGANERQLDTRPVRDATVTIGHAAARTSASGTALVPVVAGKTELVTIHAVAGDTLRAATLRFRLGR